MSPGTELSPLGKKRIALALEYPLMQQGGTEVLVRELLQRLSPDFDLVLVSGDRSPADFPPEQAKRIVKHYFWDARHAGSGTARDLAWQLRLENLRLAHFHLGGTYEWRSNRFWRCPIYHLAGSGVPCLTTNHLVVEWLNCGVHPRRSHGYKLLAQAFAWLSRSLIFRRLDLEICVSQHDRRRLIGTFPQFKRKIVQQYHSLLSANEPAADLHGRSPVVLCVGTIGGRKAQPILVEAFAQIAMKHPEWQLELVGRVDVQADVEKIRQTVRKYSLGNRVNLSGWLTDEQTKARMKRASIFAIPSIQEGLGLSLQEALFNGCVGVGTRAGGIPELIDDEKNGLLVPAGDVQALSAALDRLISDESLLERLRLQARPSIIAKGMTADAMVENYRRVYRRYG